MTKDMRIAVPMENGVLCAHFGHWQTFSIVNVKNGEITDVQEVEPPEHAPGLYDVEIKDLEFVSMSVPHQL